MHQRLEQTFYVLASAVLAVGLFVVSDSDASEVQAFKFHLRQEFAVAFEQTIGDGPVFENVELVVAGITEFYSQAADATIALLSQPETDEDIIYVFGNVYQSFAHTFSPPAEEPKVAGVEIMVPENFMKEEPVYNIVPAQLPAEDGILPLQSRVAGAGMDAYSATVPHVNELMPWVTLKDNITGQFYCTAIYNGEVSTYEGECKNDYD